MEITAFKAKKLILYPSAVLAFLCISQLSLASSNVTNSTDPFLGEWNYFDGINSYKLVISPSTVPGQDYSIYFTSPGGDGSTDYCQKTSDITFNCAYEQVSVTRDAATYSVKLNDPDAQTYQYYAPNHQPPVDAVTGVWSWNNQGATYHINIAQSSTNAEFQVSTSDTDQYGNHCDDSGWPGMYQVTTDADGAKIFSHNGNASFKFDPKTNMLINPAPGSMFHVGMCIYLMGDVAVQFTKDKMLR